MEKTEITFKVLILGDTSVGKTALFHRFTAGTFTQDYKATIGVDFAIKRIQWAENVEVTINFWDMAGQERFYEACKSHFRQTDGVFCVMDLSNPLNVDKCHKWKDRADNLSTDYSGQQNNPPIICLANKYDLFDPTTYNFKIEKEEPPLKQSESMEDVSLDATPRQEQTDSLLTEKPVLSKEDLKVEFCEWSKNNGYSNGFMVSAKTKEGIDDCLHEMISLLVDRYMREEHNSQDEDVFKLGSEKDDELQQQSSLAYYYNSIIGRC